MPILLDLFSGYLSWTKSFAELLDLECISVDNDAKFTDTTGGLKGAYELYGQPDPVARSLAAARSAPTSRSLRALTAVGLYSGRMSFKREITALGGCIRAVGEWSVASRAVGRLDIGDVEFFEDVLSGDHALVHPSGVEAAVITASCVDYSSAGAQRSGGPQRDSGLASCRLTSSFASFPRTSCFAG